MTSYTYAVTLFVMTVAVTVALLPASSDSGLQWLRVPLPMLFAVAAGWSAYRAQREGKSDKATDLLALATLAVLVMMGIV